MSELLSYESIARQYHRYDRPAGELAAQITRRYGRVQVLEG